MRIRCLLLFRLSCGTCTLYTFAITNQNLFTSLMFSFWAVSAYNPLTFVISKMDFNPRTWFVPRYKNNRQFADGSFDSDLLTFSKKVVQSRMMELGVEATGKIDDDFVAMFLQMENSGKAIKRATWKFWTEIFSVLQYIGQKLHDCICEVLSQNLLEVSGVIMTN